MLASPYARRGFVDHRRYDHSSILRFLEWRFLGAPADGPGTKSNPNWWLTTRDHFSQNVGWSLLPKRPEPELEFALDMELPQPTPACLQDDPLRRLVPIAEEPDPFELSPEFAEQTRIRFPVPVLTPWLDRPGPQPRSFLPERPGTPTTTRGYQPTP